jgi:hypothetical protein
VAATKIQEGSRSVCTLMSAFPGEDLFLFREFGVLDLFERCKAIAAEAHFLSSSLAHVGIIWIVKFLEQDEVGDRIFAARAACDFHAADTDVTNGVDAVFARKLSVKAPDRGRKVVVDAGYLLTSIEHDFSVSVIVNFPGKNLENSEAQDVRPYRRPRRPSKGQMNSL